MLSQVTAENVGDVFWDTVYMALLTSTSRECYQSGRCTKVWKKQQEVHYTLTWSVRLTRVYVRQLNAT